MPLFRRHKRSNEDKVDQGDADRVWNRAALHHGGTDPREADLALAALLSIHSVAMNGGLLHSVENHSDDELTRGIQGYQYFGLSDAAAVVTWVRDHSRR